MDGTEAYGDPDQILYWLKRSLWLVTVEIECVLIFISSKTFELFEVNLGLGDVEITTQIFFGAKVETVIACNILFRRD